MPHARRGLLVLAPAFLVVVLVPRVGAAGPTLDGDPGVAPADGVEPYPNVSISGVGGLGTPLGWAGVEAAVDPVSWLSVSGGAGLATGTTTVGTVATMVRLRVPMAEAHDDDASSAAFTAGVGVSRSRLTWPPRFIPCFELGCHSEEGDLWWNNFEVGLESRGTSWIVRWFGGFGIPSNPDAVSVDREETKVSLLPYLGVSVGRALF